MDHILSQFRFENQFKELEIRFVRLSRDKWVYYYNNLIKNIPKFEIKHIVTIIKKSNDIKNSYYSDGKVKRVEYIKKYQIKRAKIELDLQKERDSKFFSEVIRKGVMLPAQLQPAENVLEAIRNPQSKYQFSEGSPEVTGEEAFKEFVKSYPQIVQFSEVATEDKAADEAKKNKYTQIKEQLKNGK